LIYVKPEGVSLPIGLFLQGCGRRDGKRGARRLDWAHAVQSGACRWHRL